MKLLWHEFATETRRRWPFVVLFAVLVLLDFAFVMQWFDPEPVFDPETGEILNRQGDFRSESEYLTRGLLQITLWASALVVMASISPMRPGATVRIRPVNGWQRFGARALWIVAFFGLPWWIHEFAFVRASGFSVETAFLAAAQRALLTGYWWLSTATLGWVTGSIWKAGLMMAIGLIVMQWADLSESLGIDPDFGSPREDHSLMGAGRISEMLVYAMPLIGLWVGYIWLRRGTERRWKLWIPFVAACLTYPVLTVQAAKFTKWGLIRAAADRKLIDKVSESITVEDGSGLGETIHSSDFRWKVRPRIGRLGSDFMGKALFGNGVLTFQGDGASVRFERGYFDLNSHKSNPYEAELRHFLKAPEGALRVFVPGIPDSDFSMIPADPDDSGMMARLIDSEDDRTGQVNAWIDVYRFGEIDTLPLDGQRQTLGTLGEARVRRIYKDSADWKIELRSQGPEWLFDRGGLREPRRIFALRFPEEDFLQILAEDTPYSVGGMGSSAPVRARSLKVNSGFLPATVDHGDREFLKNAQLILFESPFVGRIRKSFEVEQFRFQGENMMRFFRNGLHDPRPHSESELEQMKSEFRSFPEDLSPAGARRFFYRLSQLQEKRGVSGEATPPTEGLRSSSYGDPIDIKGLVETVPEIHRPLAREIAIEFPYLAPALGKDFWRDSDRAWIMRNLSTNQELQKIAARKGWLAEEPETIRQVLRSSFFISDELIEAGIEADLDEAKRQETRSFYSGLEYGRYEPARRFPEFDAEIRAEFEKKWKRDWERDRWKMRLSLQAPLRTAVALGRLGDESLLRESLEAYLDSPLQFTVHQTDPWPAFQAAFGEEKSDPDFERVRHWLASNWEHQPETLTWRLLSQ